MKKVASLKVTANAKCPLRNRPNLPPQKGSKGSSLLLNQHFFQGLLMVVLGSVPSLQLTVNAPENRPKPKRKGERLQTINFQG